MVNNALNEIVNSILSCLVLSGWANACNGLGVQLFNGQVVAKEGQHSPDKTYIGIADNKGTYCYIREGSTLISLSDLSIGSCQNGQAVTVQLRTVGVSNNPKNTAQNMADNIYSTLYNCEPTAQSNLFLIDNISISPNTVDTDYHNIFTSETGQDVRGNLVLAAVDFTLSFDLIGCALPDTKLC